MRSVPKVSDRAPTRPAPLAGDRAPIHDPDACGCFCPEAGLMAGVSTQLGVEIAGELRARLKAVAVVMVVASGIGLLRRPFLDVPYELAGPLAALALVAGTAALLFSRARLSLAALRVAELGLFAVMAAMLAYIDYAFIQDAAVVRGDAGQAVAQWYRSLLHALLLISAYALFIPNRWPRAALVTGLLAAVPFALGFALVRTHGAVAQAAQSVLEPEPLTTALLVAVVAVVVAVYGTHLIHRFRTRAAEAGAMGQYRLEERIGEGGMGEVWRARHELLARPAAIKLIRPERLGHDDGAGEQALRRFEREARATASLSSAHTIELYDFGISGDGLFYYVMEFLDGLDLDTLVRHYGPVPAERAVHLLTQACDSLGEAHDRGLIHRDVKPANLFTCRMGRAHDFVKVLDFGLVKQIKGDFETALTLEGVTSGTPAFMSPEAALGEARLDHRSDIYALGCVAYWLLTGRYVFEADSPVKMVVDHVNTMPVPPSHKTEIEVPAELDAIVVRCLAKDPADRFASTEELAEELAAVPFERPWGARRAAEWWGVHRPVAELAAAGEMAAAG